MSNSYVFDASIFESEEETQLYQLSLSCQGAVQSDESIYYFYIRPLSANLTVNGKTALTWNQVHVYSSQRQFVISSERPWTASSSVEWLVCNSDGDHGTTLTVDILERELVKGVRSGTVTVTNGAMTIVDYDEKTDRFLILDSCGTRNWAGGPATWHKLSISGSGYNTDRGDVHICKFIELKRK